MTAQQARLEPDGVDQDDVHVPGDGPHDVEDLDPEVTLAAGTVDFGAVRVPVPARGTVEVELAREGRMQAVHVSVPEGRLSVSALAAPRSSRLWPDLVKEIDSSLREGGARVRSFQGDWGRELHATSGAATSRFVGVDGARWMLYGVATGPTGDADALDEQLRRMLRGTIVVRGRSPYPVRTVLPLEVPEHLTTVPPAVAPADRTPPGPGTVVPQPISPLPAAAPAGGAHRWTEPVPSGADDVPLDAGPEPDDRPTEIRPGPPLPLRDDAPPTEPIARHLRPPDRDAARTLTGPWPPDPQPVPSTGGRRRLREPAAEVEPRPGRRRAPEPEPVTGRRRAPEAEPRTGRRRRPDPPAAPPVDSLASPASGRWRAADGPMSAVTTPVYDVLRPGRHAATGPAPDRGAETQPWTGLRPAVAEAAPWVGTARDRDPGSATVPLALVEPVPPAAPDRPTGRHHRPD